MAESRRKIKEDPMDALKQSVLAYSAHKAQMDAVKKLVDSYNNDIKNKMAALKLTELEVDGIRASISITEKDDFNEAQAIEILRLALPDPDDFYACVKKREYLDDDGFEKMCFQGKVDPIILLPCRTPKAPTVTLRISKVKK